MDMKNPIDIKFIGWFQILGAFAILFTLNVQQTPPINVRFAVPFIPELVYNSKYFMKYNKLESQP